MQQIYLHSNFRLKSLKNLKRIGELINHPQRLEIERRVKIIDFFDKYGAKATKEAFGVSRSTVYLWKKTLSINGGQLVSLAPLSKAPKRRRRRDVPDAIKDFIVEYRIKHPKVGQETIKPALDIFCDNTGLKKVSISSIGRLIKDLKEEGLITDSHKKMSLNGRSGRIIERRIRRLKKRRRNGYKPAGSGDLIQIDSISIFEGGIKRYLITAIDLKSRFGFAYAYNSLSSLSARDFMEKYRKLSLYEVRRVQTDNGSEFEKHFRNYISKENIIHYHNYPRHPQSNGCIERFNRTLQEQYVYWNIEILRDTDKFNAGLMDYLLWYNTQKPHKGLNGKTPMEYILNENFQNQKKSNMYGDSTFHLQL
ncbi:MAG: integrase core domain-containing protein [Elusimicrobiota bacterium]